MTEKERERRRQRLRLFTNNNQWIKKQTLEQTLEEMSAQLREYRKDLQKIRLQEAATEAKIDQLDRKVQQIEAVLRDDRKNTSTNKTISNSQKASHNSSELPTALSSCNEGHSSSYCENGMEEGSYPHFTINMYA